MQDDRVDEGLGEFVHGCSVLVSQDQAYGGWHSEDFERELGEDTVFVGAADDQGG